jgi:hypothetical protein
MVFEIIIVQLGHYVYSTLLNYNYLQINIYMKKQEAA